MVSNSATLSPTIQTNRIQSLDIMRGLVVFGILIMNINGMGLAGAYDNPSVSGGAAGWDLITWITANMFFEGTMRALFSLLFGVGMFILLDRLEKKGAGMEAANIYFRRLLWLLIFGLIHGYILLWEGEILYNYALMGFIVFPFRFMNPKRLIGLSILLMIGGAIWTYVDYKNDLKLVEQVATAKRYEAEGKPLSKELSEAIEEWHSIQEEKSAESVAEHNEHMRKDYFSVVAFLAPIITHENEHFPYRHDWYDVLGMMLIGIAFFKLNILSAEKSYKFYGIMAFVGYTIGLTVNYYETKLIIDSNFSFIGLSASYLTYELGRIPVSLGHIALIMIFCKMPILNWLKNALSAVGKMALTNYVMHSIFALFIFTGAGFGLFGKLQRHELMYIVFAIWIFQLITSPIWLKYYRFGPLEWIWRNLSYQKKYALRK